MNFTGQTCLCFPGCAHTLTIYSPLAGLNFNIAGLKRRKKNGSHRFCARRRLDAAAADLKLFILPVGASPHRSELNLYCLLKAAVVHKVSTTQDERVRTKV
jgi:hypothetical protein